MDLNKEDKEPHIWEWILVAVVLLLFAIICLFGFLGMLLRIYRDFAPLINIFLS